MSHTVLTVTLNPAVDQFICIENFKPGVDHRVQKIFSSAGGKGVNVARALRHLGVDSLITGFVGGVNGLFLKKELAQENIHHQFVEIKGEIRSNLTVIDSANTKITRILEAGARINTTEWKLFKKKFFSLLMGSRCVIFSGSLSPGLQDCAYLELIELAREKGVKTALDTSGKPLKLGLNAKPSLIKPNREEASQVLKKKLNSVPKIKEAVKYLIHEGLETVIISLGDQGAVGARGLGIFWARSPQLRGLNTIGCGDTLLAAFVAADLKQKSFEESLRFAVAAGAVNTMNFRPGAINNFTIKKILKQTTVIRI